MLWVKEEVDRRGGMDPNDIAKNPLPENYEPQELGEPEKNIKERKEDDEYYQTLGIGYLFATLAIASPVFVLVIMPKLLALSKKRKFEN